MWRELHTQNTTLFQILSPQVAENLQYENSTTYFLELHVAMGPIRFCVALSQSHTTQNGDTLVSLSEMNKSVSITWKTAVTFVQSRLHPAVQQWTCLHRVRSILVRRQEGLWAHSDGRHQSQSVEDTVQWPWTTTVAACTHCWHCTAYTHIRHYWMMTCIVSYH